MNYIAKLQQENAELNARLEAACQEIDHYRAFLTCAKFIGTESGERKDWISTGDVNRMLEEIRVVVNG